MFWISEVILDLGDKELKKLSIVILFLTLVLVNGCNNPKGETLISKGEVLTDKAQQGTSSQTNPSSQLKDNYSSSNSSNKEERFIVTDSDIVKGWKKLKAKVFINEIINIGDRRVFSRLDGDRMIEYSIHFPGNWTLRSTVFEDSNNKKVAELFPVVLLKKDQESIFLDYNLPKEETEVKVIDKKQLFLNGYNGSKLILQVDTGYGTWYPHMHFLSNRKYGFSLSLYSYSKQRDESEKKLFNDIVNTFRFE
jgi:hypothetical protein